MDDYISKPVERRRLEEVTQTTWQTHRIALIHNDFFAFYKGYGIECLKALYHLFKGLYRTICKYGYILKRGTFSQVLSKWISTGKQTDKNWNIYKRWPVILYSVLFGGLAYFLFGLGVVKVKTRMHWSEMCMKFFYDLRFKTLFGYIFQDWVTCHTFLLLTFRGWVSRLVF